MTMRRPQSQHKVEVWMDGSAKRWTVHLFPASSCESACFLSALITMIPLIAQTSSHFPHLKLFDFEFI